MKNLKNVIVYGVILLLCVAAVAGYFIKKATDGKKTGPVEVNITAQGQLLGVTDEITGKSEADKKKHLKEVMKKSTEKPADNPIIGIGTGTDYSSVTAAAIKNAGGLEGIIKKGDIVLIKPNQCISTGPDAPQTTDYRVVQEVVNEVLKLGAARVVIAEGCFYGNAFDAGNLATSKYDTIKNAVFYNFNDCDPKDCYDVKPENSLVGKSMLVPKIFMDADVVIDIAKLKSHFITIESLCLKNYIGVPSAKIYGIGTDKSGLHNLGLNEVIVDLNKIRKPDFCIIDGIIGGEGDGPVNNTPVNSNVIFAGTDPVAIDTIGTTFMGKAIDAHILLAEKNGLGTTDLKKIKVVGADLDKIKMSFQ